MPMCPSRFRGNGRTLGRHRVMKENDEKKLSVLELRARGKSFEEISLIVQVDVQRIMQWTRERQDTVKKEGCNC